MFRVSDCEQHITVLFTASLTPFVCVKMFIAHDFYEYL